MDARLTTSFPSAQMTSRKLSRRCLLNRRLWMYYQPAFWRYAPTFLHRSLATWQTCRSRKAHSQMPLKQHKFCLYSRNQDWIVTVSPIFGQYPIYRQSQKYWSDSFSHDSDLAWNRHQTTMPCSGLTEKRTRLRRHYSQFSMTRTCTEQHRSKTIDSPRSAWYLGSVWHD